MTDRSNILTDLLPRPKRAERTAGRIVPDPTIRTSRPDCETAARYFRRRLSALGCEGGGSESRGGAPVTLEIEAGAVAPEGYRLVVNPSGVHIVAGDVAGLLYGVTTLSDITSCESGRLQTPCCVIEDAPAFPYRGFMLDSSRHFLPSDYLRGFIDAMASLKLNRFHWHLSDDSGFRLPIASRPRLTEVGAFVENDPEVRGYYSRREVSDIISFAAERGVTVIPEIDVPGHAFAAVTAYPELCCTGTPVRNPGHQKDLLCAGSEATFRFLEEVIADVASMFPGPYIHLGGDEAPKERWSECPRCQARMREEGLADEEELQAYFFRRAGGIAARHGKAVVGWEETLSGGERVPEDLIVQWWRHRTHGSAALVEAMRRSHRVIASPNSFFYLSFPTSPDEHFKPERTSTLEKVYSGRLLREDAAVDEQRLLLGGELCVWTEYLTAENIAPMILPRALAVAEILWSNPTDRDVEDLRRRAGPVCRRLAQMGLFCG